MTYNQPFEVRKMACEECSYKCRLFELREYPYSPSNPRKVQRDIEQNTPLHLTCRNYNVVGKMRKELSLAQ